MQVLRKFLERYWQNVKWILKLYNIPNSKKWAATFVLRFKLRESFVYSYSISPDKGWFKTASPSSDTTEFLLWEKKKMASMIFKYQAFWGP